MIAILVLILCLYWYAKRKYDLFVWGLSILLSNLYYFVLPDPMFDYAATALVVIICGMEWLRDCRFFYYKKDKINIHGRVYLICHVSLKEVNNE